MALPIKPARKYRRRIIVSIRLYTLFQFAGPVKKLPGTHPYATRYPTNTNGS
jgi:hypothetical protein